MSPTRQAFAVFLALFLPPFTLTAQKNYPPVFEDADTHTYRSIDGVDLNLHAFKPKGWSPADQRPAVVFFFGGGWNSGSPAQFEPQARHLATRGLVAITADYRVASRHGTKAIDCVEDAREAMRWVRTHAAELGIDPNRIAAGGGSAGGHIAACLGTILPQDEAVSSRPAAMILFNPACVLAPIDAFNPGEDRSEELRQRMGVSPEALSPAHHVAAGAPPCVIFHGKSDPTVPYETAVIFAERMNAAGNRCVLHGYEGATHGFFNFGRGENEAYEQTLVEMDAFLMSLGWIEA